MKPYGLCQHKEWTLQPLPPLPPLQPKGTTAEGARTGEEAELQAAPPHPRNERPSRLICFTTGYNTGDCFLAAAVTHTTHTSAGPRIPPTNESIRILRNKAGLQGGGSTSDTEMIKLLRHLSYGCVLVQPSRKTATILNATTNCTQCITVAMHGKGHVEPVVLGGTVQVRRLTEIVAMLSTLLAPMVWKCHLQTCKTGQTLHQEQWCYQMTTTSRLECKQAPADHALCSLNSAKGGR